MEERRVETKRDKARQSETMSKYEEVEGFRGHKGITYNVPPSRSFVRLVSNVFRFLCMKDVRVTEQKKFCVVGQRSSFGLMKEAKETENE